MVWEGDAVGAILFFSFLVLVLIKRIFSNVKKGF